MSTPTGSARLLASGFLKFVRLYTYNTPVRKGSSRLMLLALRLVGNPPADLKASTRDGRLFAVDLTTGMQERVFFFGEYEPFITELIDQLVVPGDVCVDAGANFGWYTTLLANLVGRSGSVHAFEPVPQTFIELQRNAGLLKDADSVELNQVALTDSESEATITLFDSQPTGHASLAGKGLSGTSLRCETIRLDRYLDERSISNVRFLKADVEGAELSLLKGATSIFRQSVPPLIVMEMALNTSRPFGYVPNDLIEFIGSEAAYDFYKIDEANKLLIPITGFSRDDIGANVLCVPVNADERVRSVVKVYLR